tara:strand:- start:1556 stop:2122 length:567 start_codon:yes stop_codon:yes gene_type:complete
LLESPQKYQHSEFQGKAFISAFRKSRENILNYISKNTTIAKLSDVYATLSKHNSSFEFKNSNYTTNEFLIYFLTNDDNQEEKMQFVEKLLKNFEIHKKIFSNYEFLTLKHSENYTIMENYVLFSLVCAKIFKITKNLKFLNTLLKLNDILSSRVQSINESVTLSLIHHAINFELEFVNDLLKTKVVKL